MRTHLPRTDGDTRSIVELANQARFVARRREDALDVRGRRLGQNLDRSGTKRGAEGHHALALHEIAHDLVGEADPAGALVEGFEVPDIARHACDVVVLKILTAAGQRVLQCNTCLLQHLRFANTR